MKKKVLILGVASVQMDAILELKKMGYETHACAMAKDGPGADVADYFIEINILDTKSLVDYIKENKISLVYSVGSDLAMPVVCNISQSLDLPHFVSAKTAEICNNKDLMRTKLGNGFKGNVKHQIIKSGDDKVQLEFPFILKPADSQGQRGVRLINSLDEYKLNYEEVKKYSRSGTVIIEQYINGPEVSVNGYMIDGELKYLITSDRETWPDYTGLIRKHVVPPVSTNAGIEGKIKEVMIEACNKMEIKNGPVYAQIKLEKETPYIIEITPRLDGCHMWNLLSYHSNINLLKLTFEHLLNDDISELEKVQDQSKEKHVLEFICQSPNTPADYSEYHSEIKNSIYSFNYYKQGESIRPVNGKHEKIGYFIYKK